MAEQVAQPFENVLARGSVVHGQERFERARLLAANGEKAQKLSCAAQGRPDAASRNARVEFRISKEPLQPGVLLLKVFQPLRLVDPQPTELLRLVIVGLLRHADLLDRLQDGLASSHLNLDLS